MRVPVPLVAISLICWIWVASSAASSEREVSSVAGTWLWQCCSGNYTGTLTIEQHGDRFRGTYDVGQAHDPIEGWVAGYDVHFVRRFKGQTQTYDLKLNHECGVMVGPFLGDRNLAIGNDFRAITPESAVGCSDRDTAIRLIRDSRGGPELLAGRLGRPRVLEIAKADGAPDPRVKDKERRVVDNKAPDANGCYYTTAIHHRCTGVPYDLSLDTEVDKVCNGCLNDSHCTERPGGRCVQTTGGGCGHDSKACAYPGNPCHHASSIAPCPGGGFCWNQNGRAVCGPAPTYPP
jgi:hypothetical protein